MNNLSKHIEYLLLTHNYVVVPQFGAFVTRENQASRIDSEDLFFPPNRTVRFNSEITQDDGLLVGLIQAVHHVRPAESKRIIQRMVLDLRQQLLSDGQVDFGSLGLFSQDEDAQVTFEPCQAGAVTPSLFGLDAFTMPKLTSLQRNEAKAKMRQNRRQDFDNEQPNNIIIRINRRSLRNAMAAAAAIIVCVLFATPVDFISSEANQASIVPSTSTTEPTAVSPTPVFAESKQAHAIEPAASVNVEESAEAEPSAPVEASTESEKNPFCIVLASNVSRNNAERYVKRLQDRGFENVEIFDNGKFLRVIITGFATENAAQNRNIELHRSGREFADTWVMKL